MDAEYMQQIYGGEINDYYNINHMQNNLHNEISTSIDLENIYINQVQNRGSVDTTGIYHNNGISLNGLIDRQPDAFQKMLNNTLTQIAHEIGLNDEPSSTNMVSVLPREQTLDDIQQARDNVAKALAELKLLENT